MKKKIVVLLLAAALLAVGAAGTLAYFSTEATAHNVVRMGTVSVDVVEEQLVGGEKLPYPTESAVGVMPGTTVSKIASVKNNDLSAEAWIRARVVLSAVDAGGQSLPTVLEAGEGTEPVVSFTVLNGWTDGGDGWYYYNTALGAGQTTSPLFEEIAFSMDMDNSYKGCTVSVDVNAQAVQTANNPVPAGMTVRDVAGWPAE